MKQFFAVERKTAAAIGHHALPLRHADRLAQIGFFGNAVFTLAALRHVQWNHVITPLQRGHTRPHVNHDARAFVPQNCREQALRVRARQRELVGMANPGGLDFHQHLARARPRQIDIRYHQRRASLVRNRSFDFHAYPSC